MIPAQCTACGETVLSLSRAFFQFSLTTECQSCRRKVRKRGGWGEIFAIFFFAGLILYAAAASWNDTVGGWFWLWAMDVEKTTTLKANGNNRLRTGISVSSSNERTLGAPPIVPIGSEANRLES